MDKYEKERLKKLKKKLRIVFSVIFVLVVVYLIVTVAPSMIDVLKSGDEEAIESFVSSQGASATIAIVLLQVLQTITIVFPGIPIYMVAGIVLGRWKGMVVCYITYVISNAAVFIFSRTMKETADELMDKKTDSKIEQFMHRTGKPKLWIMLLCVIPVVPNGMVPYIASNTGMSTKEFVQAVDIGCIPCIILFVLCGDLLLSPYFKVVLILIIAIGLLGLLGYLFKGRFDGITDKFFEKITQKHEDKNRNRKD